MQRADMCEFPVYGGLAAAGVGAEAGVGLVRAGEVDGADGEVGAGGEGVEGAGVAAADALAAAEGEVDFFEDAHG